VVFPPKELVADDKKTKISNPKHARMVAKEHHVLNYLLSSLSHEMLLQAATYDTPIEVWSYIMSSFESQSRAHVINVCVALSTTKKGDMTIRKYVSKMKSLEDEMAYAGKRLDDEELVSYILAGLDSDFDGVISAVSTRVEPITVSELYGLLAHEEHWELRQTSEFHSAHATSRGGHGGLAVDVAMVAVVVAAVILVMASAARRTIPTTLDLATIYSANYVGGKDTLSRSVSSVLIAPFSVKKSLLPWLPHLMV
jgi:hypothetical protein